VTSQRRALGALLILAFALTGCTATAAPAGDAGSSPSGSGGSISASEKAAQIVDPFAQPAVGDIPAYLSATSSADMAFPSGRGTLVLDADASTATPWTVHVDKGQRVTFVAACDQKDAEITLTSDGAFLGSGGCGGSGFSSWTTPAASHDADLRIDATVAGAELFEVSGFAN